MHTQTQSTGKHRWAIAAPLFLLMLTLSLGAGRNPSLHASAVQSDSLVTTGTQLIYQKGLLHLHVGDMDLEGWNGGFEVTKNGESITVAALSTPVFVRQGNHQMIIPAFMQWKAMPLSSISDGMKAWMQSRAVLSLPETFSQDALQDLATLASAESTDVSTDQVSLFSPQFGQELRLPSARERADSLMRTQRMQALQDALLTDPLSVDALLAAPDMPAILASAEGADALPGLLTLALSTGKGDLFLPSFASTSDLQLLAAFHPLTRDHTRVLAARTDLTDDEHFTLLLGTPLSDTMPQGMSSVAVSQWQAAWEEVVQTQKGVIQFAASLPILQEQIERLDTLQYPQRVDTYTTAILAVADSVQLQLPPQASPVVTHLRTLRDARRLAAPIADVASSSAASISANASPRVASTTISPTMLVQQADAQLQQAGFMSTADTQLQPINGTVQVSHIIFGTPKGDRALGFTFDPQADQINAILFDGKTLPNTVTLQQFVQWLRTK